MIGLEQGRNFLQYSFKTTEEVFGIGEFKRRKADTAQYNNNNHPKRPISPNLSGTIGLVGEITSPLTTKLKPEKFKTSGSIFSKNFLISRAYDTADMASISVLVPMVLYGHLYWEAAATKLGYNILAQIVPDVIKLAKGKISQTAKPDMLV